MLTFIHDFISGFAANENWWYRCRNREALTFKIFGWNRDIGPDLTEAEILDFVANSEQPSFNSYNGNDTANSFKVNIKQELSISEDDNQLNDGKEQEDVDVKRRNMTFAKKKAILAEWDVLQQSTPEKLSIRKGAEILGVKKGILFKMVRERVRNAKIFCKISESFLIES